MVEYPHLIVEDNNGVRTITLNRPERLNAVNPALADAVPQAINDASSDDAVRVVVITGAGRGFCAGLDLNPESIAAQAFNANATRTQKMEQFDWVGYWAMALVNCDKPVIAAINGAAAGAGFGLTLGADIRLVSDAAKMTTGYTRRGLSPDAGVTYFLPRLIGLSRATELVLTARDISAEEALRIGLVTQVIPATEFKDTVAAYAAQLAEGAPIALTYSKRLLTTSLDTDLPAQLKNEYQLIKQCFSTADMQEAIKAFAEKRKPVFTGK